MVPGNTDSSLFVVSRPVLASFDLRQDTRLLATAHRKLLGVLSDLCRYVLTNRRHSADRTGQ
jgi:hypothetical protein